MEMTSNSKIREIDRIIDLIGYTRYHLYLFTIIVLIGFADGIEIMVLNLIMKSFEDEWNLTKFQKGMIVSSKFIGIFIATLAISKNKDVFGRKLFIKLGLIITMIFGFLSSLARPCYERTIFRLLMGIGVGAKTSSKFTLVRES